jgi:hypothetical protein
MAPESRAAYLQTPFSDLAVWTFFWAEAADRKMEPGADFAIPITY